MHIKELIESLPTSSEKNKYDAIDLDRLDIHTRLAAALSGAPRPVGLKPLSEVVTLDEAPRRARLWDTVVIPDGTHEKLAESLSESAKKLPEDIHARAAKALCR